MGKKKEEKERIEVDFNQIVRNKWRTPRTTAQDEVLRLGKLAVDALDAQGGQGVDAVTKRRLDQLADVIVNPDWENESAAPYVVLALPLRIVKKIDGAIDKCFAAGVYAEAHRLLYGEEVGEEPHFDDIEVTAFPSLDDIGTKCKQTAIAEEPEE